MPCLFCQKDGPFTREHVIPESLGNDELILFTDVCKGCNNHFSQIEEFVLQKTPLAFWRSFLGIQTKSGSLPSVDLSQPKSQKGIYPSIHSAHDNNIGFTAHEDGTTSVEVDDSFTANQIHSGEKTSFQFVFTPLVFFMLGRFLCKIGVELICLENPGYARSDTFRASRQFARQGSRNELWPIFHFSNGSIEELKKVMDGNDDLYIESKCYSYEIREVSQKYILLQFSVGTDNWVICLNNKFPTPEILQGFPNEKLSCMWYPAESLANNVTNNAPSAPDAAKPRRL